MEIVRNALRVILCQLFRPRTFWPLVPGTGPRDLRKRLQLEKCCGNISPYRRGLHSHTPCSSLAAVTLDWTKIRQISASIPLPLILAGGLTSQNVARAIRMVQPYAVDVISGVEKEAGVKDGKLMQRFVCAAKGFNHSDKDKI